MRKCMWYQITLGEWGWLIMKYSKCHTLSGLAHQCTGGHPDKQAGISQQNQLYVLNEFMVWIKGPIGFFWRGKKSHTSGSLNETDPREGKGRPFLCSSRWQWSRRWARWSPPRTSRPPAGPWTPWRQLHNTLLNIHAHPHVSLQELEQSVIGTRKAY